jgi:hypothetical protein
LLASLLMVGSPLFAAAATTVFPSGMNYIKGGLWI